VQTSCCNFVACWECFVKTPFCVPCGTKVTLDSLVAYKQPAASVARYCTNGCMEIVLDSKQHVCPNEIIVCKCKKPILRKEMAAHKPQCHANMIPCKYAKYGCTKMLREIEIEEHLKEAALAHNELLENHIESKEGVSAHFSAVEQALATKVEQHCPQLRQTWAEIDRDSRAEIDRLANWARGKISLSMIVKCLLALIFIAWLPFLIKIPVIIGGARRIYKKLRNPEMSAAYQKFFLVAYTFVVIFTMLHLR